MSIQKAASVAIFDSGHLLLVQRARMPWQGAWSLPGGRCETGESAEDCARREVREELGITLGQLTPVTQFRPAPEFDLHVFACHQMTGPIFANDEIADWLWVLPQDIADLKTTPRLLEIVEKALRL